MIMRRRIIIKILESLQSDKKPIVIFLPDDHVECGGLSQWISITSSSHKYMWLWWISNLWWSIDNRQIFILITQRAQTNLLTRIRRKCWDMSSCIIQDHSDQRTHWLAQKHSRTVASHRSEVTATCYHPLHWLKQLSQLGLLAPPPPSLRCSPSAPPPPCCCVYSLTSPPLNPSTMLWWK